MGKTLISVLRALAPHPGDNTGYSRVPGPTHTRALLHQGMADLCADRTTTLYDTRHPFHPSRVGDTGGGLIQNRPTVDILRFEVSHPSHKNKDVARVGHPVSCMIETGWWGFLLSQVSPKSKSRSFDSAQEGHL